MSSQRGETGRQKAWKARNPWARYVEFARRRCRDTKHRDYKFYGAKGVTCDINAKEAKLLWERDNAAAMACPSLDRIDPELGYTFANCRFIEKHINERLPHDAELREEFEGPRFYASDETSGMELAYA